MFLSHIPEPLYWFLKCRSLDQAQYELYSYVAG